MDSRHFEYTDLADEIEDSWDDTDAALGHSLEDDCTSCFSTLEETSEELEDTDAEEDMKDAADEDKNDTDDVEEG